ncbi:SprT family protein [Staphylococcus chromogenes]|uniref:SprT family protein n=1 Tax=Staphylococcus chromogenes TaxID=46126 RepID=UPI000D1A11F9|nr:SprT family protein [Staphylococcus chromogenes]PTF80788.1 SprT family protein [Staphylococcus chromogenes]PTG58176.1 SprT family protein [Staphylococcus chromogenes]RIM17902.1 SprT family protein [Staphylococcus chromogenes]
MLNQELQQYAENLALTSFGKPFRHRIYFNHRLRSTGGRYLLKTHDIEINPKQYEHFGLKELDNIIKHELCHYFLHLEGKGYQHRDRDFRQLALKVGAPRFCNSIESYETRANYEYMCKKCHKTFLRIRRVNTNKMRCGQCGGSLKLVKVLK